MMVRYAGVDYDPEIHSPTMDKEETPHWLTDEKQGKMREWFTDKEGETSGVQGRTSLRLIPSSQKVGGQLSCDFIPYKVINRTFTTLHGIITGSLCAKYS